jgi:hypothetical protein
MILPTFPNIINLQTPCPRLNQATSLSIFATTSPTLHSRHTKVYMIPTQSHALPKRVLRKFSFATHKIGWCSLAIPCLVIPLSIVASLNPHPHNHHTFLSSTSQQLSKIPLLQKSTAATTTTTTLVRASC